jgi:3-hydroxyacyl-CoA dehydrogenase/enoyl-CoA hydratase/3-hydroxybutyryl-CoA epimerase
MIENKFKNWDVNVDENHILWLYFDRENKSTNTISHAVLDELDFILTEITQDSSIKGVIIASRKSTGFIAGADIEQFTHFSNREEALSLIRKGQSVINRLAALSIPTVAMVKGFCLGGGFELVLACTYRVAEDSPKTRFGLPEVLLGIHPGWGGTIRLPRLIGAIQAMDLILSGRTVDAKTAKAMGVVDMVVADRYLKKAAISCVLDKPKVHQATTWQSLTNQSFVRPLLARVFRNKTSAKISPDHYPAPFAAIDNWERYGVTDEAKALSVEAESLGTMALTDTARNLVRVFFLQERLKNLSKGVDFQPQHVHVIGAGTMGGDIAAWCALRGLQVTLQDREPKFIAPAIKRAYELFKKKLKVPRLVQAAMDRLTPDPEGLGIPRADVIIEAIYENLEAKQQLFKMLEEKAGPNAILATNTSSIPLDEINRVMKNPSRLVGIHFFNPVAKMQLVEVVEGKSTQKEVIDKVLAFVRRIDRLPLPVKSSPGFLVNRVLMPYLMEAMALYEEGVPPREIDKAALKFGMPMGPIELADTVGLDVCLAVAKNLSAHFGGTVPEKLQKMVAEGKLGRKSGEGFYRYTRGKLEYSTEPSQSVQKTDIADRLILRMLNEAASCLREQVVADADLLDAGMILGTGFAPFRGGPMHYAKTRGLDVIRNQLEEFATQYGNRFKPDAWWNDAKFKNVKKEETTNVST